MVVSDVLRCVLYNIVCPCAFWPWYCLTFFDVFCITLNQQGQSMLYKAHRRTSDTTMAKTKKDKQCYSKHIEERQTIPWPKPTRTAMLCKRHRSTSDNAMAKTNKDKPCYTKHIEERQTLPLCFILHCLSLLDLAIVVSDVLRCDLHNMVCPCWFSPWHCLMFFDIFVKNCLSLLVLAMVLSARTNSFIQNKSKNVRQYHGQSQQGQTM
jgi:hypothetical protein